MDLIGPDGLPRQAARSGHRVASIILRGRKGYIMLEKPELKAVDEEIYRAIELEKDRQQNNLEMEQVII